MSKTVPPYIPELEGLKFIGVALILLRHAAYAFNFMNPWSGFLQFGSLDFYPFWVNGWIGIDLFFVLCGFLIARSWMADPGQSPVEYIKRRFWRVLPAYYVLLLLCYIGIPLYNLPEPVDAFSIFYHIVLLEDIFVPGVQSVLGALAAELKFFILMPFVILFLLKRKNSRPAVIGWVSFFLAVGLAFRVWGYSAYYVVHEYYTDYYMFFLHTRMAFIFCLEPIFLGVGIAWLERRKLDGKPFFVTEKAVRGFFWGGIAVLLVWLAADEHIRTVTWFDAVLQPVLTASIMAAIVLGTVFGGAPREMGGHFCREGARLAFGAYITHIPLIPLCYAVMNVGLAVVLPAASIAFGFWVYFAVYVLIVYAASEALYHLVEKRFRKEKKVTP